MSPRYYENVTFADRQDIQKRHGPLVRIHDVGILRARRNLAKGAVCQTCVAAGPIFECCKSERSHLQPLCFLFLDLL